MKKNALHLVGACISFGLIYLLLGQNLALLRNEMADTRYIFLVPCVLFLALSMLARAVRWRILLSNRISFWHSFHISNIGFLVNSILPLRMGEVMRAWITTRRDGQLSGFTVLSSIVIERVLDLLALLIMIAIAAVTLDLSQQILFTGLLIGGASVVTAVTLFVLSLKPSWGIALVIWLAARFSILDQLHLQPRLESFIGGLSPLQKPQLAFAALLWTGIAWFCDLASGYVILFLVFPTPTLAAVLAIMILLTLSVTLPAVPGNLGPFQAAVVGGLWMSGMITSMSSPDNLPAIIVGVWLHILTLSLYILLGLIGISAEGLSIGQLFHEWKRPRQQPELRG